MHNQSVCRRQLLLHYSVASIDTTLHSQLVGQGERARAAQVAMDALVDRAAERERERNPRRTFAAGLDWFCHFVKAKAVEEQYEAGVSGAEDWVQQLTDVASVCDQWLESLA